MGMLRNLYGSALPARMQLDQQILSRCLPRLMPSSAMLLLLLDTDRCMHRVSRLPGLPSSRLGLQSMTGDLDEFGFEAYLGMPEHSENPGADLHSAMEERLKAGTQPVTRAIL